MADERMVTINGERALVAHHLKARGISWNTYQSRRRLGMSREDAITYDRKKKAGGKKYPYRGLKLTVKEIAKHTGRTMANVRQLLRHKREITPLAFPKKGNAEKYPYKGQMMTVREIAELTGISEAGIYDRIKRNGKPEVRDEAKMLRDAQKRQAEWEEYKQRVGR